MEDKEEPKEIKISDNELDTDEIVESGVKQFVESPHQENVNSSSNFGVELIDERETLQEQGIDSVTTVMDEDQFEPVSLKDQDKNDEYENSNRSSGSDNKQHPFGGNAEDFRYSFGSNSLQNDSSPVADKHHDNLSYSPGSEGHFALTPKDFSSSISFDSSGYSIVNSPPKPRNKHEKPNVSPELLHLVDSAIMGKPEGMDKLKNIASGVEIFESGEEMDSVPFLIVDSLLATMGGVESFEEDEDNNPPSVMLNSRAAIVAGELIPWLSYAGDTDDVMSPRTRMVRGLLVILRACTRNRAMCSTAGLLGVLLRTAEKIFTVDVGLNGQMRWDGTPLCHCIQYLAGHSLSVSDLYRWFQVITKTLTTIWAPRLTLALEKAISGKESMGPACTFEFDGESSGLLGPATVAAAIAAAAASRSGKSSAMSAAAAASALAGEGKEIFFAFYLCFQTAMLVLHWS